MAERTDPRITRTEQALRHAIVQLATERRVSQITVADLAERAGVTRATFYNRYGSPLELLLQVLCADLERGHRQEDARRAEGGYPPEQMLRLAHRRGSRPRGAVLGRVPAGPARPGGPRGVRSADTPLHRLRAGVHRPMHPPGPTHHQPADHRAVRRPRLRRE